MDCGRGGVVNRWYCVGRWGGGRGGTGGVVKKWHCMGRWGEGRGGECVWCGVPM